MSDESAKESLHCVGCGQPIEDDEAPVYADEGVYHMGCDMAEVYNEVGSGGFDRAE